MLKTIKIHLFNSILFTIVLLGSALLHPAFGNQELARELLKAGKFTEALPLYEQLHQWYPADANIQYELAVCLSETGNLGTRPIKLLLQLNSETSPPERSFYLAKNFHAENDFETALQYYERYEAQSSRKSRKKTGFDDLKAACLKAHNPFVINEMLHNDSADFVANASLPLATVTDSTQITEQTDTLAKPTAIVLNENGKWPWEELLNTKDTMLNMVVSNDIQYKLLQQFRTIDGRKSYIEGINLSAQLKWLVTETDSLREAYRMNPDPESQQSIALRVTENEMQIIQLKSKSDMLLLQSIEHEAHYWQIASSAEILRLKAENDSIENAILAISVVNTDISGSEQVLDFEEMGYTHNPETASENATQDEDQVDRIVYKIQIGAYSKGLPQYVEKLYRKLSVLRKIDQHTNESGVTVYTIGEVQNFQDAITLQEQIRTEGVKDAFVVAYHNGKRITLKEAKAIMEK